MSCPLCGALASTAGWIGGVMFEGRRFEYRQCSACASLYCRPMPDETVLGLMYGPAYLERFQDGGREASGAVSNHLRQWLMGRAPGRFIDFGCGAGDVVAAARQHGWDAMGIEFDARVARDISVRTGAAVLTPDEMGKLNGTADVVHLGDVIEHLTALDRQLPEIVRLLKPGGSIIAQGPLEANPTFFSTCVRLGHYVRGRRTIDMPPYHVVLATATGQRRLFRRHGLREDLFVVSEVDWPAPGTFTRNLLREPRELGLYILRRLSRAATRWAPANWGNRYFYVGSHTAGARSSPSAARAL